MLSSLSIEMILGDSGRLRSPVLHRLVDLNRFWVDPAEALVNDDDVRV